MYLPLQVAIFVLVPELYGIDDVLPNDVSARGNDSYRVEERVHEPDAHDIVLLPESLTAIDALAPDSTDGLTQCEEDYADD